MAESADPSGLEQTRSLLADGVEITDVAHDSRGVAPGAVYVCLRGSHFDGHEFIDQAIEAGAVAVVTDHAVDRPIAQIVVDDTRLRAGPIASLLFGQPSADLVTVGLTGTNGKTTTAQFLDAIFAGQGWTTGVVGTLHGPRTTPEAPELQRTLRSFVDAGARAAVLEVSSHALALHRVDGTEFDAVVFSNLGHDHLDLHGSREEYFRAKARLFTAEFAPLGVINIDDPYGRLLADTAPSDDFRVVEYSLSQTDDIEVTATAHRYRWRDRQVEVPIGGRFNVANSLAALTAAVEVGIDPDAAIAALRDVAVVPGRFEVIGSAGDITVVVDYAHTPDGLAEALPSARAVVDHGRVIVVFGCGGDRDRDKRPGMGAVAAALADRVVVTSDNPRSERPQSIIDDIVGGVPDEYRARVVTEPDRRRAIRDAIMSARHGDIVVIAGKGHEATQEIDGEMLAFDDRQVAREILEGIG